MKILNDITCNLNEIELNWNLIKLDSNIIEFHSNFYIGFKYIEWNFNSIPIQLNSIQQVD
jgi:hypothetical protein